MDNQYQSIREPSGKEVWYSSYIYTVEQPKRSTSTLSRYKNKIKMTTVSNYSIIEFIRKSQLTITPKDDDQYYLVDAAKKYRPDVIANDMYGTPLLYWVILAANGLDTYLDVKPNMTLRIPQLTTLFNNERVI